MRCIFILLMSLIVYCATISSGESASISVKIGNGYDGSEVWAGVVLDGDEAYVTQWSNSTESEFLIEVPNTQSKLSIVMLKKNFVPIVLPITAEVIADGITVEFTEGMTIVGSVLTKKDSVPITEGSLSVTHDESAYKYSLPDPKAFSWEIDEDGTFAIRGIPPGEHTVSVIAPDYMPAKESVLVTTEGQQLEVDFLLPKAEYISGHMEVYVDRKRVMAEIDIVVTPPESQTVGFATNFDTEQNFRIGPFAEDSEIGLRASLPNGQRSLPRNITVPTERDVTLWLYDWVRIFGTVQDKDTGEPIPEFTLVCTYSNPTYEISDPNGQFSEDVHDNIGTLMIIARGYRNWDSGMITLRGREEFDFGTIELDHAYTVKGRVLDRATREPIEGASVVKLPDDDESMDIMHWNYSNVSATTDADGKFELDGFRSDGGNIRVSAHLSGYSGISKKFEDVNAPLEIELEPLGSISGHVVSIDGEPVAAYIHHGFGGVRSDDGNFHFNVGPGTHRYRASASTGVSQWVEIPVESGEAVEGVRIAIDIVGRVRGRIEGLVEGETASVWTRGTGVHAARVHADGPYEMIGLESGVHVIGCTTSLRRTIEIPITMDESKEVRVDFQFPDREGSLSGRVTAAEQPLYDYTVFLRPVDTNLPTGRTETNSDGSFKFNALAKETYQVEVPSRAFVQEVEVDGATNMELSVGDHSLSGQLRTSGSLLNARILLESGLEDRRGVWRLVSFADANGSFRFDGLPSGTYTIEVTHTDYAKKSQKVKVNRNVVDFDIYLEKATSE